MAWNVLINLTGPPGEIPSGIIAMWSGLLSAIPPGWALCDGLGGRPDLRNRFIKGGIPGTTGGNVEHKHELPFHLGLPLRTLSPGVFGVGSSRAAARQIATQPSVASSPVALSDAASNEPPYYTLAFIIKL